MSVIYCSATAELSEGKGTVCVLWLCVCALSADVTEFVWWERRVRGLKDSLLAWHSPVYSRCVLLRVCRLPAPLHLTPPHPSIPLCFYSSSYPSCFSPFVHDNTIERTLWDWTQRWRKERTRRKHNKIPPTKESKQPLHVRVHFFLFFFLLINPKQEI